MLESNHNGLREVKERIVRHLAAPYDLSDVLFIATPNTLATIPAPLLPMGGIKEKVLAAHNP